MLEKEFTFTLTQNLNELKENEINDFIYGQEMSKEICRYLGLPYAMPIEEDWGFFTALKEVSPGAYLNLCLVGQPLEPDVTQIDRTACPLEYRISVDAYVSILANVKSLFEKKFKENLSKEAKTVEDKIEAFLKSKGYAYKAF